MVTIRCGDRQGAIDQDPLPHVRCIGIHETKGLYFPTLAAFEDERGGLT